MKQDIHYVAKLDGVSEVSIRGRADLPFWKDYLSQEALMPTAREKSAEILIVGAKGKFMGVEFQELSFSIFASCDSEAGRHEGLFLIQAFNSNAFFAWSERTFFHTPYSHARVKVSATRPASIRLRQHDAALFDAEMNAGSAGSPRRPSTGGDGGWEGSVFLPGKAGAAPRMFLASLKGRTFTYGFSSERDEFMIHPSTRNSLPKLLLDSNFTPEEWIIRENAHHAKSKTYNRSVVL